MLYILNDGTAVNTKMKTVGKHLSIVRTTSSKEEPLWYRLNLFSKPHQ